MRNRLRDPEGSEENTMAVIFFDLGGTLGDPRVSPTSDRLEGFDPYPFVRELLEQLRDTGHRLGLISDTGPERAEDMERVLTASNLFDVFDPTLLIYSAEVGMRKDSPAIFERAAREAGVEADPSQCLFVGENPREVCFALDAGFRITRDPHRIQVTLERPADFHQPEISNLATCIDDARLARLEADPGPDDPTDFNDLLGRLESARLKMPPLYRETFVEPFTTFLRRVGRDGFSTILFRDPERDNMAGLMLDMAHTILQNAEKYEEKATDGFQEVVSDLYDGFLSAHDRRGIKPPDHAVIAPLVKWGNPLFGPYTWPSNATRQLGASATLVSLPPSHARHGLVGWSALAHETAGHDILSADEGLAAEMSRKVGQELSRRQVGFGLAQYWSARIDETASDVMGILNMGPAAAIGLIAYFRGLSAAAGGSPRLRNEGSSRDLHPADILRGYLGAGTVRRLSFEAAPFWANVIENETDRDLGLIRLAGVLVPAPVARESAETVAEVLATWPMATLNNHSLIEIQDWDDVDEEISGELRRVLTTAIPLPAELADGVFAAHVVAAATTAALQGGASIPSLFSRMVSVLKIMHDRNPSWGPAFVIHPSTITRHVSYIPAPAREEEAPPVRAGEPAGYFRAAQLALAARGKMMR
jgi:histidinol phosphatase-like enzyme